MTMTLLIYGGILVVGLVWFTRLIAAIRQHKLTKAILALIKRLNSSIRAELRFSAQDITDAERDTMLCSLGLTSFFYPWKNLHRNVEVASRMLRRFYYKANYLTDEDWNALSKLLDAEQKLLAHRSFTRKRQCEHREISGADRSAYAPRAPIVTASSGQQLNPPTVYGTAWCTYCLASWRYRYQVPVIAR